MALKSKTNDIVEREIEGLRELKEWRQHIERRLMADSVAGMLSLLSFVCFVMVLPDSSVRYPLGGIVLIALIIHLTFLGIRIRQSLWIRQILLHPPSRIR